MGGRRLSCWARSSRAGGLGIFVHGADRPRTRPHGDAFRDDGALSRSAASPAGTRTGRDFSTTMTTAFSPFATVPLAPRAGRGGDAALARCRAHRQAAEGRRDRQRRPRHADRRCGVDRSTPLRPSRGSRARRLQRRAAAGGRLFRAGERRPGCRISAAPTVETRDAMGHLVLDGIAAVLDGRTPPNMVK